MRTLKVDTAQDPVTSDILFVLQLHATNGPLLPELEDFDCEGATMAFIPFIPSLLSHKTTSLDIEFAEGSPTVIVASMITRLPMLCPNLERINLNCLPRDPIITEAASELLLSCNRDFLQWFCVDSPLTEEAHEAVFQLPKLSELWVVIQGHTQIPPVGSQNLSMIDLEYDDHLDWLQGFRGALLTGLENVYFTSQSEQIGDFLDKFTSVALTTSATATLSTFGFNTSRSWDPNYRSLLPFTQLKDLQIESSCDNHCSSRVDDDIIMDLTRAMPKLEILKLGGAPCGTERGATVMGLITLARGCRHLSELRIHFRASSLVEAATGVGVSTGSDDKTMVRRQECVLTDLEVGEIPIPKDSASMVAMTLLYIFPRLLNIEFTGGRWGDVAEKIKVSQRIRSFVQRTGKVYLLYLTSSSVTFAR